MTEMVVPVDRDSDEMRENVRERKREKKICIYAFTFCFFFPYQTAISPCL